MSSRFGLPTFFSIAVVGPMSDRKIDKSVPIPDHLANIGKAIDLCADALRDKFPNVLIEHDSANKIRLGAIPKAVFGFLDRADLVIADVSHDSPNTFYEIAYLHALGTPVIYLNYKSSRKIAFYLQNQLIGKVDDFHVEDIKTVIQPLIEYAINKCDLPHENDNLITQYFGVPMVDASAVTGVAVGYVHNFMRHVLDENLGVLVANDEVDQIVCIRPESISDAAHVMRQLAKSDKCRQGVVLDAPTHPARKLRFTTFDRIIVDYPTPITSLQMSPRYQRSLEMLRTEAGDVAPQSKAFERKLINGFFTSLAHLTRTYPGIDPNPLRVMSAAEFLSEFDTSDAMAETEASENEGDQG